ncbi:MAG: hypothetical protein FWG16_03240 [Micrococcales bacterium]|nr:hypothetical protein [Micrococcales bacterium]
MSQGAKFCPGCGGEVNPPAEAQPESSTAPSPDQPEDILSGQPPMDRAAAPAQPEPDPLPTQGAANQGEQPAEPLTTSLDPMATAPISAAYPGQPPPQPHGPQPLAPTYAGQLPPAYGAPPPGLVQPTHPPAPYGPPMMVPAKPRGGWLVPYRIIAAFVAVVLLTTGIWGLLRKLDGGPSKSSSGPGASTLLVSGEVSEASPTLSKDGVGLTINPIAIQGEHQAEIRKVSDAPLIDDTAVEAYDFSIEGVDQLEAGVVDLTIPLSLSGDDIPSAAYWNEPTGQWEPVYYMYQDGTVTITTDHLSTFGVFATQGSGRYAKARYINGGYGGTSGSFDLDSAAQTIKELGAANSFPEVMQALKKEEVAVSFGLVGSVFDTLNARYPTEQMQVAGYGMAAVSVVIAMQKMHQAHKMGDQLAYREAVGSVAWDATSFVIDKVFDSTAVSAAFAAGTIVDFSLDQLKKQQLQIQQDAHYKAYTKYYAISGSHYRSMPEWFNLFYQGALTRTNEEWQQWVKDEIDSYVNQFWNDDSGDREIYLKEQGLASTYGYLDNSAQALSNDFKYTLYRQFQECDMWDRIADKVLIEMTHQADLKMVEMQDMMNRLAKVQYQTGENYEDTVAVICPDDGPDFVETPLASQGRFEVTFTMWAHIQAGGPGKVEVRDEEGTVLLTVELPTLYPGYSLPTEVKLPDISEQAEWQLIDTRIDDTSDPRYHNNWIWDLSGTSFHYATPDTVDNVYEVNATWSIPNSLASDQAFSMTIDVVSSGSTGSNKSLWFDISPGPLDSKEVDFFVPCDSSVTLVASEPWDQDTITYRLTIWPTTSFFIYIDYVYSRLP